MSKKGKGTFVVCRLVATLFLYIYDFKQDITGKYVDGLTFQVDYWEVRIKKTNFFTFILFFQEEIWIWIFLFHKREKTLNLVDS